MWFSLVWVFGGYLFLIFTTEAMKIQKKKNTTTLKVFYESVYKLLLDFESNQLQYALKVYVFMDFCDLNVMFTW